MVVESSFRTLKTLNTVCVWGGARFIVSVLLRILVSTFTLGSIGAEHEYSLTPNMSTFVLEVTLNNE